MKLKYSGVTTAAIEQNSFTFDYELPAPDSVDPISSSSPSSPTHDADEWHVDGSQELAAQAATDVSLARCSVCLCDLEQGDSCRRLPCLHMFHKDCIDDWLKRNRSWSLLLAPPTLPANPDLKPQP